ncbi:hypothetical protein, partial [Snodgrassella alvi]|uniref:hypothetical protein n=3 Tax=Snodgrassella alvi TaxID=1196083 RepID=UPI000A074ED4
IMLRKYLDKLIANLNELRFIVKRYKNVIESKLLQMDIPINYNEINNLIGRLLNKVQNVKNKSYINKYDNNNFDISLCLQQIAFCKRKILSFCNNPENSEDLKSFILTIFPLENTIFLDNTTNSDLERQFLEFKNTYEKKFNSFFSKSNIQDLNDSIQQIEFKYENLLNKITEIEKSCNSKINQTIGRFDNELKTIEKDANQYIKKLQELNEDAEKLLEECKKSRDDSAKAYGIVITNGLAGSFKARAKFLNFSTIFWIIGLILSLLALWGIGVKQIHELKSLYDKSYISSVTILLQALTTLLSISAPLWFAWLSTTQINKLFKLSEDYGFKSSVSQSYEGYRKETSVISTELQQDLMKSLIKIINDEPLRLVNNDSTSNTPYEHIFNKLTEIISSIKALNKEK